MGKELNSRIIINNASNNYLNMIGALHYEIIPCSKEQIVDGKKVYSKVYSPEETFDKYKPLLDIIIFNQDNYNNV